MKQRRILISVLIVGVVIWWFGFYVTSFIPEDVRRLLLYTGPIVVGMCAGRLLRLRRLARIQPCAGKRRRRTMSGTQPFRIRPE